MVALLVVLNLAAAGFLVYSLPGWLADRRSQATNDAVAGAFSRGEIQVGDSVQKVLSKYPPNRVERSGKAIIVTYDEITIAAESDRIVFIRTNPKTAPTR